MNRNAIAALAAVAGVLVTMVNMHAHHSTAEFDSTKPMTVTGVVTQVRWESPHSWLYVDVTDANGKVINWGFEFSAAARAVREGLNATMLKRGVTITVTAHPARDVTRHLGNLRQILFADGSTWQGGPIRVQGSGS